MLIKRYLVIRVLKGSISFKDAVNFQMLLVFRVNIPLVLFAHQVVVLYSYQLVCQLLNGCNICHRLNN